jgi:hypothetical protein
LENEVNNNVIVDNMYKQHDGVIKNILNSDINHTIIQNKYKTHIVTHSDPFYEIPLNKETYINIEERKALIIEDTVNKIMNELNSYDTMDLSFIREIVNKAFR